jgi:hypothetical protein
MGCAVMGNDPQNGVPERMRSLLNANWDAGKN